MDYPKLTEADVASQKVIVRVDLDVPIKNDEVVDPARLESFLPTVKWLLEQKAQQIFLVGHIGRCQENECHSTKLLLPTLEKMLEEKVGFGETVSGGVKVILLENLRADPGEEKNDSDFSKKLASLANIYVNEAFGSSHREHASIVGIPQFLVGYIGLHFEKELENLDRVRQNPKRPLVVVLSGVKEDKLDYLSKLKEMADKVLVAGRLPLFLGDDFTDPKVVLARLIQDKEDITIHSVEAFEREIAQAKSVVVSGPIGKYEEEGHRQGTFRVFRAVAKSSAFKLAGGGDTEAALVLLKLGDEFDWISTGGGAMLEYLTKGTLPALEALIR